MKRKKDNKIKAVMPSIYAFVKKPSPDVTTHILAEEYEFLRLLLPY